MPFRLGWAHPCTNWLPETLRWLLVLMVPLNLILSTRTVTRKKGRLTPSFSAGRVCFRPAHAPRNHSMMNNLSINQ